MTIKEVEKRVGITSANIRFYEKEGLLEPERNAANNYREYSEQDVECLKKIKTLRMLGVGLADIKNVMDGKEELTEIIRRRIVEIKAEEEHLAELEKVCCEIVDREISFETLDSEIINEKEDVWKDRLMECLRKDITQEWVNPKQMNRTVGGMLLYFFLVNAAVTFLFGNYFIGDHRESWLGFSGGVSAFGLLAIGWTAKLSVQLIVFQLITFFQIPWIVIILSTFMEDETMAIQYTGIVMLMMGVFVLLLYGAYRVNSHFFDKRRYGIPLLIVYAAAGTIVGGVFTGNYIGIGIALLLTGGYVSVRWSEINLEGVERYNKYYTYTSAAKMVNLLGTIFGMQYMGAEGGYGRYKK